MFLKVNSCNLISKLFLIFLIFLVFNYFFVLFPYGAKADKKDSKKVINIGAIIDLSSRIGKEEKTAMEIAVSNFNNYSKDHYLSLHFHDHQNQPFQAVQAAERLIKEKEVKAIIGMERWDETTLVAEIGSQAQIPVISFARPPITLPLTQSRWPFLVRIAYDNSEQIKCISELIRLYNWRRVITIHEDTYGGDSGQVTILSQALQKIGSEIEYSLILPQVSSLHDSKQVVREELMKLDGVKSRVFIVLHTTLPLVINLFREAKEMGMVGEDSVWILTDSITSFLDTFNTSVIYSMEGALGFKAHYSDSSSEYKSFYNEFRRNFRSEYPEVEISEPGFYALRAYDSISTIIKAMEGVSINNNDSKEFLNRILSSDFSGLTGQISFKAGELLQNPTFRIVNVVGKKYKEIDFWFPKVGLINDANGGIVTKLNGPVNWPGDLQRTPKGWKMATREKPMIIGVPVNTSFEKFVKIQNVNGQDIYDGYCIKLFYKVIEVLGYNLPYRFERFCGTYDDLVNQVYNKILSYVVHKNLPKTFDAVVGDITILAERSDKVEFTQPYAESGLSMIAPVKFEESAWMFLKPFTWQMWVVTGAILIYTIFIVWFLEHQSNPEFEGSLKNQIGTATWFTFSSLFFAHREKVYSNLTRLVVVVWLFVVLILNSSYTADLTSILTIQRLQPNVIDIEWLKQNNLPVGCDGDSFVRNYLRYVLGFRPENIKSILNQYNYTEEFENKRIYAAFLELPYQKVFTNYYCGKYIASTSRYRFGGLGFVFQKGSPIAADVSKAILKLSADGELKELEDEWFTPSSECSTNANNERHESLRLKNFCGLFVISGATSTICFLMFLIHLLNKYRQNQNTEQGNATPSEQSTVWNKAIALARFIYHGKYAIPERSPDFSPSPDVNEWLASRSWETASPTIPESPSVSTPAEIEVVNFPLNLQDSDNHLVTQV